MESVSQGKQIQELMKLYFDNYTGDIAPARERMAGQLAQVMKEIGYEKLAPLVVQVAIDGQVVSRGTLIQAARKSVENKPTKSPDRFDPAEYTYPDAIPMPDYVREMIQKAFQKPQ